MAGRIGSNARNTKISHGTNQAQLQTHTSVYLSFGVERLQREDVFQSPRDAEPSEEESCADLVQGEVREGLHGGLESFKVCIAGGVNVAQHLPN